MAWRRLEPPAQCRQAAETAVRELSPELSASVTALRRLEEAPVAAPQRYELPVYTLGVDDINDRRRLAGAEYAGWQFVDTEAAGAMGTEVRHRAGAAEHVFAQFNMGPFPASMASALRGLAAQSADPEEYDVRLLRIPALHVEGLWLHSNRDRIIPLAPAPEPLAAGEIYDAERFFVELEPRAAESIRFDNSPRTGSNEAW